MNNEIIVVDTVKTNDPARALTTDVSCVSEVQSITEEPKNVLSGWYDTHNNIAPRRDINKEFLELKGELSDEQARATLAEFLFANPAFMMDIVAGVKLFPFQELMIKAWQRNDYNLCVWGRGCGKTLAYNRSSQLISQEHGLISLPDLIPQVDFSKEGWVDIKPTWLWNGESWQRTDKVYVQPQKNCLRINTRDGFALEGSTNHLVKVWNLETQRADWKKYDQIQAGDYICISRNQVECGGKQTQSEIDEAYLVGLMIGDGCYARRKYGMRITSMDEEILQFVERYPCWKRSSKRGTNAKDLGLKTEFFVPFMEKWGIKRTLSYDKVIPASVLKHSDLARACLSGIFDTDGTICSTGVVSFTTVSEHLAHQVQMLLLSFGIISRKRVRKTPSKFGKAWQVSLSGQDARIFNSSIGFRLARKKEALEQYILRDTNTNLDVVPGVKEYAQRHVKSKLRLEGRLSYEWHNNVRRKNNQKNLSYDTLESYINFFDRCGAKSVGLDTIKNVFSDHYYFSPVTQIDSLTHDCLDFNVPCGERYWANGFVNHNSWTVSLFALYWAIFNPGCRIVVISFSFRSSRRILEQCGKFLKDKDASMLRACFPKDITKGTDEYSLSSPNGSSIICLPLGDGTKIRGVRADLLIVDEFAFLPETIIGEILRPFLAAKGKIKESLTLKEREDRLIAAGTMTEAERTVLDDRKKVIFLTSASYQFEHTFKRFQEWGDLLTNPNKREDVKNSGVSYCMTRFSYEAAPEGLLDLKEIEEAKRDLSEQLFDKEYRAKFISDSDAYFRASKMKECSVDDGQQPCLELAGESGAEYVLGIDVSLSGSEASDHFAMCLMKIIRRGSDGKKIGMVAHSYAVAGGSMKDHMLYLYFLMRNFNVVYIGIDSTQGDEVEFINACNQSKMFKDAGIELLDIDAEFKKDTFVDVPAQIRRSYNKTTGRIVQKQNFSSSFQKAANEYLQACFDHKWMAFGGKIAANSAAASRAINVDISMLANHESLGEMTPSQFVDHQDFLLDLTRSECAMIQVKTTALGTISFDLGQSMRRTTGASRVRKDSYSALLLCNWCVRLYVQSQEVDIQTGPADFPYMMF